MFAQIINEKVIAAMKRIYKAKGEAAFRHPRAIPAYLNDLLPGSDYEPCRRLIKSACENGTYELLLVQGAGSMSSRVERAVKHLCDKAFLGEEAARCAVEWAACALDPSYTMGSKNGLADHSSIKMQYSQGLAFEQMENGSYMVTGIGTCQDRNLIIPPTTPQGGIVTTIGLNAFRFCDQLVSVVIPMGVTIIEYTAFSDCGSLTSVQISGSVAVIKGNVFSHCEQLSSLTVASSNPQYYSKNNCIIDKYSKMLLIGIRPNEIPHGVIEIMDGAFTGYSGADSIVIPSSVERVGMFGHPFIWCKNVRSLTVEPGNKVYYSQNNCLIEKETKRLICGICTSQIPYGVVEIKGDAFSGCVGLTSVTIPSSVTKIGWSAFAGCTNLRQVVIPSSVNEIEKCAFWNRDTQMTIQCAHRYKPIGWHDDWCNKEKTQIIWNA